MKLIIGYGNTLRSDDGVGQKIAETVAEWQIEGVRSLAVQQLTPELAADMAEAELVIFVDASIDDQTEVQVKPIEVLEKVNTNLPHSLNPSSLLSLTHSLYQHFPQVYCILIPGVNFEFGEEFSAITTTGMAEALKLLKNLLN